MLNRRTGRQAAKNEQRQQPDHDIRISAVGQSARVDHDETVELLEPFALNGYQELTDRSQPDKLAQRPVNGGLLGHRSDDPLCSTEQLTVNIDERLCHGRPRHW
jgi:hypothetical protein